MLPNANSPLVAPLLPSSLLQTLPQLGAPQVTLRLNQIEGFEPVKEFTDESNTPWKLVKAASNSTVDVPDPKQLQIVDYWNHEFPGLKNKLYCYVVEGIKQPRVETEQATRILYQWFSPVFVPTFTPQLITPREWLKANIYAAPILNIRLSKLNALCRTVEATATHPEEEDKLLQVEELQHGRPA